MRGINSRKPERVISDQAENRSTNPIGIECELGARPDTKGDRLFIEDGTVFSLRNTVPPSYSDLFCFSDLSRDEPQVNSSPKPSHLRGARLNQGPGDEGPLGNLRKQRNCQQGNFEPGMKIEGTCQDYTLVENVLSDPYPSGAPRLLVPC